MGLQRTKERFKLLIILQVFEWYWNYTLRKPITQYTAHILENTVYTKLKKYLPI